VRARAAQVGGPTGLPLERFVDRLTDLNAHSDHELIV
jgi:hypothetical protein